MPGKISRVDQFFEIKGRSRNPADRKGSMKAENRWDQSERNGKNPCRKYGTNGKNMDLPDITRNSKARRTSYVQGNRNRKHTLRAPRQKGLACPTGSLDQIRPNSTKFDQHLFIFFFHHSFQSATPSYVRPESYGIPPALHCLGEGGNTCTPSSLTKHD